MTAKLTIAMDDDLIRALSASGHITVHLSSAGKAGAGRPRASSGAPREGSLPARILEWSSKRGKDFGTADVEKKFKLSRAHASMLLSTMAKAGRIDRASRGVYRAGS